MNKTAAYTNTITLCSSPASSAMRNYMNTDIPPRSAIIMEVKNVRRFHKADLLIKHTPKLKLEALIEEGIKAYIDAEEKNKRTKIKKSNLVTQ